LSDEDEERGFACLAFMITLTMANVTTTLKRHHTEEKYQSETKLQIKTYQPVLIFKTLKIQINVN